jgi:hypothetical protein
MFEAQQWGGEINAWNKLVMHGFFRILEKRNSGGFEKTKRFQ